MKVGEAIVELLEAYSVDQVFGIPGTHSIELYRGLSASSIRHVLPRHEQGAGFMADGYARYTGKPGVCFVITGPGVTNISTAMAQAFSDSVPMLVISPVNDPVVAADTGEPLHQGRLHELIDQAAVTRGFSAFSEIALSVDDVPALIGRAFTMFQNERPRPAHIHIPLSILNSDTEGGWQRVVPALPDPVDPLIIDDVVASINAADNPVIVAGGGCRHFGEVIITLADKIPAPVVTTIAARGVIQGTHPLYVGAQPSTQATQALLESSDFMLAIGTELSETDFWDMPPALPKRQVWLNLDPNVPFTSVSGSADAMTIVADAQPVILDLSAKLDDPTTDASRQAFQRAKAHRDAQSDEMTPVQRKHWRVLTELRKSLAHDVVVTSDMTQLAYTACEFFPLQTPNTWFHPNGYGTLGYALPAAIGIKCGHAEVPVLVIVGDAGFQYTMAELAVAAELGLNIVVLLWNNDALQQIADDMAGAGIEAVAVNQQNPDFGLLVQSLHAGYRKVNGLSALGPALDEAFITDGPVVLELHESTV